MIKIFSSGRFKINRKYIVHESQLFATKNGVKNDVLINVVFIGRRKMIGIAKKYKKEDVALPVLSFAYNENDLLGEVFICYPQAVLLAAERERGVDKMMVELVCHGIQNILA
jgi:ssRNA-specific RNase YbeY (16S rRNA maturation enzyme)